MIKPSQKILSDALKTVAFIAGKKNPAIQTIFIRFSIQIKLEE